MCLERAGSRGVEKANGKNRTCPKMSDLSSHGWSPGSTVYRKESTIGYGRDSHP